MTLPEIHREHRLGSVFSVEVDAPGGAGDVLAAVLDEVTRLEAVFDPLDPASEFSRWRRGEVQDALLSTDLAAVLAASERFWVFTQEAFHPGADPLVQRWRQAERDGVPPTREAMLALARTLELPYTAVNGPIVRTGDCTRVDLNSIARGYIVDRATEAGWRLGAASGLCVIAGGDRRHVGDPAADLSVAALLGRDADPAAPRPDPLDAAALDDRLQLRDAALSTRSRHHRARVVGTERFGDLLDPSTGWPATRIVAAAALAPDAMTADVLATAIGVGRTPAGGGLPGCAWLAVAADGRVLRSENWPHVGRTVGVPQVSRR